MPTAAARAAKPAPGRYLVAAAMGLWLLVAAVVLAAVLHQRSRDIQQARAAASATTALMEAHTARTFQVVDLALDEVARDVATARLPRHDASTREAMKRRLEGMPYVRALFVIGEDGAIQHDTDPPATPDLSLADSDFFRAYLLDPALKRAISAPLQSRSGAGWFVAVTRRIGEGRGVAVAAMQLEHFSALYQQMGLGPGHHIALFHRDGRLLAQHPPEAGVVGRSYRDFPLFSEHLPLRSRGTYVSEGPPLAFARVTSYHRVDGAPLVVALAHDLDAVLAGWRATAAVAAAGLLLLAVASAAALVAIVRLQEQRQRSRERQAQGEKMEALGLLTGSITHDFANLLGIVSNNLELLRLSGTTGDARAAAALARAQRALDTGTQMTRQLMTFARQRPLAEEAMDVNDIAAGAVPLLQQAAGSGIEVGLALHAGAAHAWVDRAQLEVALINLVVNARDALGGQGLVLIRTEWTTRQPAGAGWRRRSRPYLALSIEDDGPGMPEAVRRRAVEPFFTTKGEGGTGLGLAQVYGLLRQLGGDLEIDSAPGQGTTVRLLLRPAFAEAPRAVPAQAMV